MPGALMGSANKVPIWNTGCWASVVRRVVPVSGLTGFAITSLRSHNLWGRLIGSKCISLGRVPLPDFTQQR
jgi:hypothetical protein